MFDESGRWTCGEGVFQVPYALKHEQNKIHWQSGHLLDVDAQTMDKKVQGWKRVYAFCTLYAIGLAIL